MQFVRGGSIEGTLGSLILSTNSKTTCLVIPITFETIFGKWIDILDTCSPTKECEDCDDGNNKDKNTQ